MMGPTLKTLRPQVWGVQWGWVGVCFSDELPGDADAPGLGTTTGKPWLYSITQVYLFHDKSLVSIIFSIIHTFISACPHSQQNVSTVSTGAFFVQLGISALGQCLTQGEKAGTFS